MHWCVIVLALLVSTSLGCKKEQQRPEAGSETEPAERPPPQVEPEPGTGAVDVGAEAPVAGECPPPKESDAICAQVITWAKLPQSGTCCQYPSPCTVPDASWQTFTSEADCRGAGVGADAGTGADAGS